MKQYVICAFIGITCFLAGYYARQPTPQIGKKETILHTEVKVDTLRLFSPVPYNVYLSAGDTIYFDSCKHVREIQEYRDTNFYAKISGIAPRIDEIQVYPKTTTITKIIQKKNRFGIGLTGGYGLTRHGFSPFIGISFNYNIVSF